jgi:beta-glucosidase
MMKHTKFAAAMLAATILAGSPVSGLSAQAAERPWLDAKLSPDARARLVLKAMTPDEKVALLHGPMAMPLSADAVIPKGAIGSAGYIPGNDRLGLPALQESDASLGVVNPMLVRGPGDMSTALPSGLALAATFDPAIAFAGGAMIATEARAKGFNVMLAGGVNLARDPRNGRNFEYLGEDPLLAGILAGESIRGIQGTGMISTVKHFALNGQEHERMTADSVIGEAAARESDLLAFQIAIERGQPGSVMCSYNLINGVYGCQNSWTLNQVLKRDWAYPGFVMSDWGAVHTVDALAAGLDQQSGEQLDKKVWFDKPLKDALAAGSIPQARVDDAALRILRAMFAHGLVDRPPAKGAIDFEAHARVAQAEAEGAIVLLDNRKGLLPLAANARRIAVIGGHAESGVASGSGSSQVATPYHAGPFPPRSLPVGGEGMMAMFQNVVFHPSSPLAAIRARAKDTRVTFDTGAYPEAAAASAKDADVAIVFVYQPSGEGDDVPNMALPYGQDALIAAVAAANPNTIVVLETGNPIRMPWADEVAGVVQAWYAGSKGGEAIARVLFGEVNPSGRLPITWPVDESQLPRPAIPGWGAPPDSPVKVDYTIEGADVGYRWFARRGSKPRYPFGYGLSYTGFRYANLTLKGGKTIVASFDVTNIGKVAGKDVPQVYLTSAAGRTLRRLIGFEKVALAPGETRRVTVTADPRLLASFDTAQHGWRIDAGSYGVAVGSDAESNSVAGSVKVAAARLKP